MSAKDQISAWHRTSYEFLDVFINEVNKKHSFELRRMTMSVHGAAWRASQTPAFRGKEA